MRALSVRSTHHAFTLTREDEGARRNMVRQTNPNSAQTEGRQWEGDERMKYKVRRTKEDGRGNRKEGKVEKSKRPKSRRRGSGVEGSRVWSNAECGPPRADFRCASRLRNGKRITKHEPRITQKLSGRTKPFRRKVNAAREKGRGKCGLRIDFGELSRVADRGLNNQIRETVKGPAQGYPRPDWASRQTRTFNARVRPQ